MLDIPVPSDSMLTTVLTLKDLKLAEDITIIAELQSEILLKDHKKLDVQSKRCVLLYMNALCAVVVKKTVGLQ